MKLVDILARELKTFPESYHYILFDGVNGCYADLGPIIKPLNIDCSECSDGQAFPVYRGQWQAAVDALRGEKVCDHYFTGMDSVCVKCGHDYAENEVVEWNGDGLPPVGTVCEFQGDCAKCPSDPWHKELRDGAQCTVIAHFKSKSLDMVAFTFVKADGNSELEQSLPGALRPILTPEQIAAEEKSEAIRDLIALWKIPPAREYSYHYELAEAAYDAGYRKFEIVDN